jgi:CHAT domain-containing protein/Tfp pilus assembly protein PilF
MLALVAIARWRLNVNARRRTFSGGNCHFIQGGICVANSRATDGSRQRFVQYRLFLFLILTSFPLSARAGQAETPRRNSAAAAQQKSSTGKKEAQVAGDAKDPVLVAAHLQHGDTLYAAGSYQAACKEYEAALLLCDPQHSRPVATARLQSSLSKTWTMLGDYGKARQYIDRSLANCVKAHGATSTETATTLTELGALQVKLGDSRGAQSSFEKALKLTQQLLGQRHPKTIYLHASLGSMLSAIGDRPAAAREFEEAMTVVRKSEVEENSDTAFLHFEYGGFLTGQGKYAEAREQLEKALELRRKLLGDQHRQTANTLDSLGLVYCHLNEHTLAQECFEEELVIRKATLSPEHPELINGLNNLGFVLGCQKKYPEAIASFQQALALGQKWFGDNDPNAVTTYTSLSLFSAAQENWPRAVEFMEQGRRCARHRLATTLSTLSEREQLLYLQGHDFHSHFTALTLAVALRQNPGIAELSAGWLLNGKSQSQELLADRAVRMREDGDPALAKISQQLKQVRDEQAKIVYSGASRTDRAEQIAKLAKTEEELSRRLSKAGSHALQASQWVDAKQVQAALAPGEVFIDIACVPMVNFQAPDDMNRPIHYAAWVIPAAGHGNFQLIDLGEVEEIHTALRELRIAINTVFTTDPSTGLTKPAGEETFIQAYNALRTLSARLLYPLLSEIRDAEKLLISPDGQLWLVPWAALLLPDGRFAVEQYEIAHLVSGRELVAPKVKRPSNAPLIVANPNFDLPPDEARQIAQVTLAGKKYTPPPKTTVRLRPPLPPLGTPIAEIGKQVAVVGPKLASYAGKKPAIFEGNRALEPLVKAVHGPRIILFATHGFFEPSDSGARARSTGLGNARAPRTADNPLLRCGVLLAGCNWRDSSKGDDGILTGMEILGLDLRGTELVVLSACNTGVGDLRIGEGVASTRQAFQLAGAEAVVATLWPVMVDEANDQMSDFFANLAKGQGKAQALRNTQLSAISRLKAKYQGATPIIWAAFTITGRG